MNENERKRSVVPGGLNGWLAGSPKRWISEEQQSAAGAHIGGPGFL